MQKTSIEIIMGPMFAGKTTAVIERARLAGQGIAVFKPSFDTRYGICNVKSHDGASVEAISVASDEDFFIPRGVNTVFIDEIQFFTEPCFKGDIIKKIKELANSGISVICAGLDRNWQGEVFSISNKVADIADKVTRLKSRCAVCGAPAAYTFKKSGSDNEIELGAEDIYEPRCENHFFMFQSYQGDLNISQAKILPVIGSNDNDVEITSIAKDNVVPFSEVRE